MKAYDNEQNVLEPNQKKKKDQNYALELCNINEPEVLDNIILR